MTQCLESVYPNETALQFPPLLALRSFHMLYHLAREHFFRINKKSRTRMNNTRVREFNPLLLVNNIGRGWLHAMHLQWAIQFPLLHLPNWCIGLRLQNRSPQKNRNKKMMGCCMIIGCKYHNFAHMKKM